jgi:hypothetical protein
MRAQGAVFRLPELLRRIKALERAVVGTKGEVPDGSEQP